MEQEKRHQRNLGSLQDVTSIDHRIEIYRIFVETVTAAENRRQQVSAIYIGVIAAIVTIASAVGNAAWTILAGTIVAVSATWFMSIWYFRKLAKAKFDVIGKMESDLPIAPFAQEWKMFKQEGKFIGLTHMEMVFPTISGIGGLVYLLWWILCQ